MKGFANVLIFLALTAWTAAFFFGPGSTAIWKMGSFSPFMGGLAVFLHALAFLFPSSNTVTRPLKKSEMRKCRTCGRPAVSGSDLCRYHTDEMRALGGGGMR